MVKDAQKLRVLILETSGRHGQIALAWNASIFAKKSLDQNHRNGCDLAPTVAELLHHQGWKPSEVDLVLVSTGPGSYTALRVGLISAKIFAYATGAQLVGIPTFAAIASQAPPEIMELDVVADAQKDRLYWQSFSRQNKSLRADNELKVIGIQDWIQQRKPAAVVTGPGLVKWALRIPAGTPRMEPTCWDPQPESLLQNGLERWESGQLDDARTLEPLYCRPSSAEEQWQALGR